MLKSKNILFIAPDFFNYSFLIQKELETMGASVSLFNIRPTSGFSKLIGLYMLNTYEKIKRLYFNKMLHGLKKHYDYILIIRADLIPIDFLRKLKMLYPESKFIQYIWDDINIIPKLSDSFQFFNRILSYDISDAKKHGFVFRPFFYIDQKNLKNNSDSRVTDLFFIGSYHTDRLQLLERIIVLNPWINFFFYLYIHPVTYIINKIPFKKKTFFRFQKMKYSEMIEMMSNSIAILDIQNISQNGLTTRIIEALGARTKIVTTNKNIMEYEFFNSNNILIIDRNNPIIKKNWLDTPYKEYDKVLLNKYQINCWISEVFDI